MVEAIAATGQSVQPLVAVVLEQPEQLRVEPSQSIGTTRRVSGETDHVAFAVVGERRHHPVYVVGDFVGEVLIDQPVHLVVDDALRFFFQVRAR